MFDLPQVLHPKVMAEYLGVSEKTVYRRMSAGEIPHIHIGRRRVTPIDMFELYRRGQKTPICEFCVPEDAVIRVIRNLE